MNEEWTIGWRVDRDAEITHGDPPMYKFHNKFVYSPVPISDSGAWLHVSQFGIMTKEEAEAMAKLLNASQT